MAFDTTDRNERQAGADYRPDGSFSALAGDHVRSYGGGGSIRVASAATSAFFDHALFPGLSALEAGAGLIHEAMVAGEGPGPAALDLLSALDLAGPERPGIVTLGAHLSPVTGPTSAWLRLYLPLRLTGPARLRVAGDLRLLQVGVAVIFDETREHEAWSDGDGLLLSASLWDPRLSPAERDLVSAMMAQV